MNKPVSNSKRAAAGASPGIPALASTLAAALILGAGLAGCNRAEAPAAPPAAPATSSTAAPTPGPSATTPGTPSGAANSLPGTPPSSNGAQAAPVQADGAVDGKETNPAGDLTKKEEDTKMPEALHGNNHSSPALDGDAKKQ